MVKQPVTASDLLPTIGLPLQLAAQSARNSIGGLSALHHFHCLAVLQGYAQRQEVQPALRVVKKFWELGGMPDQAMFDCIAELCVRTGEFKPALQVSVATCLACCCLLLT